jgi:hypothetical protein
LEKSPAEKLAMFTNPEEWLDRAFTGKIGEHKFAVFRKEVEEQAEHLAGAFLQRGLSQRQQENWCDGDDHFETKDGLKQVSMLTFEMRTLQELYEMGSKVKDDDLGDEEGDEEEEQEAAPVSVPQRVHDFMAKALALLKTKGLISIITEQRASTYSIIRSREEIALGKAADMTKAKEQLARDGACAVLLRVDTGVRGQAEIYGWRVSSIRGETNVDAMPNTELKAGWSRYRKLLSGENSKPVFRELPMVLL